MRVSNYNTNHHPETGTNTPYFTYGYDEFGNDLYNDLEEPVIPNPYNRQGEYQPESGRFTAEDVIKGNGAVPETLNRYGYCWGNPVSYVDRDGKIGYYFYDPDVFVGKAVDKNLRNMVESDVALLEQYYQTKIEIIKMDTEGNPQTDSEIMPGYTFEKAWNSMNDTDTIDVVVVFSHANNNNFVVNTDNATTAKTETSIDRTVIEQLAAKDIDTLILFGCNMGLDNTTIKNGNVSTYNYSLAESFLKGNNANSIDRVIASDGSISHDYEYGYHTLHSIGSVSYHANFLERHLNKRRIVLYSAHNIGFRVFENDNGNIKSTNMEYRKYLNVVSLLYYANEAVCPS